MIERVRELLTFFAESKARSQACVNAKGELPKHLHSPLQRNFNRAYECYERSGLTLAQFVAMKEQAERKAGL